MKAIAAYMANKSREEENRRNEYGADAIRAYNAEREPNKYTARTAMDEEPPEVIEMRHRRDSKSRYMMDEEIHPESRYRGRDGRWKAGRRRSEMDEGAEEDLPEDVRAYEARNEYQPKPMNYGRVENRYKPDYPIAPMDPRGGLYDGGGIGFGTRDREYQTRSHYDAKEEKRQSANVGGMLWMEPNREEDEDEEESSMMLDRETAERWAHSMRNEDNARPSGARWSMEELKNMAQKFGIKPDTDEFAEFWVMTNAMYSDYCGVAKKFNITSPEFYGMMALAWMRDKDAKPNKTALYYKYIVKK